MKQAIPGFSLFLLGVALIVAGVVQNQQMGVLGKAIRVCLECIGIG